MGGVILTEVPLDPGPGDDPGPAVAVLGVPDGDGPWPGVVMVHEAFGVTDIMRRQVERLASAGYLVLMPDLYADGGAVRCLLGTIRSLRAGTGRPFEQLEAARVRLAADPRCTGTVGVLGFCMGGGFALLAATRGFDAASVNYGRLPDPLDPALEGACPVVASYGGRDHGLRGAARRLDEGLARHGVPRDVREYASAGHSFLNDAPFGPAPVGWVLERLLGVGPEPVAAADAWDRIEAFFAEHLQR